MKICRIETKCFKWFLFFVAFLSEKKKKKQILPELSTIFVIHQGDTKHFKKIPDIIVNVWDRCDENIVLV